MRHFIILIFIVTGLHDRAQSQDLDYARRVVDTLAGESMKGRGYVGDGVGKAADYIANEFKELGLRKLGKSYFQEFQSSVNTFPNEIKLSIGGVRLVPGRDFLVEAGSPGISGSYQPIILKYTDLLQRDLWVPKVRNSKNKLLVIDGRDEGELDKDSKNTINELLSFFRYHPDNPAVGTLIITTDKLTWAGSTQVLSKPGFTINSDKIPEEIGTVEIDLKNKFIKDYKMRNVIGMVEGEITDSVLVFSAHFDHLGMMGKKAMFPGANDNASGVAMLLNMAKYYSLNKPKYSVIFMAFAGEELGLLGSAYYTKKPLMPLEKIKFLVNFDIAGTGDDGIQIVNGKVYKQQFDLISSVNERLSLLPQVKIRGESCNSDHCMFYKKGVPSFFIYTLGGIQAYHDIDDKPETLPLTAFGNYFKLITTFVDQM